MAEKLKLGKEYVVKFVGKERLTSVDFVDTFKTFDKDSKFVVLTVLRYSFRTVWFFSIF